MASELMWKRLSELDKKDIEKKAKGIMLDFGKTIDKLPKMKEVVVERDSFERDEGKEKEIQNDFRKLIFENAPNKDKDHIIAERGKWTEK